MNRSIRSKAIAVAAVLLGTVGLAQAAHARTDVIFSVGIPAPLYVEPAPVYVQPRPVYVEPAPVYSEPRYGYEQRAWRHEQWRREQLRREEWRRWHHWHNGYGRDWD